MRLPKVNFFGCLTFLVLSSIAFVIDVLMGEGGSGKVYGNFQLPILILSGLLIFIETYRYLFKKIANVNKIIVVFVSIFLASLQIVILPFVFFILAIYILAPILGWSGFYVTMP